MKTYELGLAISLMGATVSAVDIGAILNPTIAAPQTTVQFAIPAADDNTIGAAVEDFRSPNSIGSIAIGLAEGTRTIDGGTTPGYDGHTDPGNAASNVGTFSCQVCVKRTPAAADEELLRKQLRPQLEKLRISHPTLTRFEAWIALDIQVQAPAVLPGFLAALPENRARGLDGIVDARVSGFYRTDGTLDAPGFGNDLARLRADQMRRSRAIATAYAALP